ncbi:MAG: PBSX family phage terminase large subunit [Angelakisella sp.]
MATVNVEISKKVFNAVYLPLLDCDSRYLVLYGGAGSGKSYFIAERYIKRILENQMCNVLVTRAVGNTNRNSTYALFKQVISRWGIAQYFRCNESDLKIMCTLNGNSIIFKGLDDTEKLKSITFAKGELTDVWVEEATETDEGAITQLDIRMRGGKTKKQMTISFNPIDINHWLKKRFFDKKEDSITFLHTTYKDNSFLQDDDKALLESFKDTDPYYYTVYCLGQWGVYGKTIFNAQSVSDRIATAPKPIKAGYFTYTDTKTSLANIKWISADDGYIKIYADPKEGAPYVLGGDTAGDGSDSFTGQVLDNITGQQVAVFKNQFDEDLYAKQIYCLGLHYNNALVGIESNFSSYPIKELERLGYTHQYVREREDTYTHGIVKAFGFKTTQTTRPVILAALVQVVRDDIALINDVDTLTEMQTFVRNEKGRPEAQSGAHDDLIMGLAIAHYIRPQQSMTVVSKQFTSKYTPELLDDWNNAGDEVKAIMRQKFGEPE